MTNPIFGLDFNTTGAVTGHEAQMATDYMTVVNALGFPIVSQEALPRRWQVCEPNAPILGAHTYAWGQFDAYLNPFIAAGFDIEIQILCQSDWACEQVTLVNNQNMSPLLTGLIPGGGMTYDQAWSDFITAILTRYPGITMLTIGAEPDSPSHWVQYGGTPAKYQLLLQLAHTAAHAVNPNIIIGRGNCNPGSFFNDNPTVAVADARIAAAGTSLQHLVNSMPLGAAGMYDTFVINYNDHYPSLIGFARWLHTKMGDNGYSAPLCVNDCNAALFIREDNAPTLPSPTPHYYENVIPPLDTRDVYIILDDPVTYAGVYAATRTLYWSDQAHIIWKKAILAMYTNMTRFFLQPSWDGLAWDGYWWHHAGLFDAEEYAVNGQVIATCLKPSFYAYRQFVETVAGADALVTKIDFPDDSVWCFRTTNAGTKTIWIWNEDVELVGADGLVQRGQGATVDLTSQFSTDSVKVQRPVTTVDDVYGAVTPPPEYAPTDSLTINEQPLIVTIDDRTTTQKYMKQLPRFF